MIIYIYDYLDSYGKPKFIKLELDQESADEWVNVDFERRCLEARQGEEVFKRTPQEIQDEIDREFINKDRKEYRHRAKYNTKKDDEGNEIDIIDTLPSDYLTPEEAYIESLNNDLENEFLYSLSEKQRTRFLLHKQGYSYRKIAELEGGKNHAAIRESILQVEKKLKKIK